MRKFSLNAGKRHLLTTVMLSALLGACSSDTSRFDADPFQSPFTSRTAYDPVSTSSINRRSAAPRPMQPMPSANVTTQPLPSPNRPIASAPGRPLTTGSVASANYAPLATAPTPPQTVATSNAGWSAIGGTPVTLQRGDSLASVSQRYNVPVSAIMAVNGLSSGSQVQPGQQIMIPAYNAVAASRTASAGPSAYAPIQTMPKASVSSAPIRAAAPAAPRLTPPQAMPTQNLASARNVAAPPVTDAERRAADKLRELRGKPAEPAKKAEDEARKRADAAKIAETKRLEAERKLAAKKAADDAKAARLAAAKAPKTDDAKITTASVSPSRVQNPQPMPAPVKETVKEASVEPGAPAESNASFRWPAKGRVISGFGARGTGGSNDGINIALPEGTPVRAAEGGTVVHADDALKGYGKLVLIRHPNGYVSVYAHNGELSVKRGEAVKRGQVIAKSGQSGNVTAPQLHFEIRKGASPVDPTKYLGE
jgi:murein DD-endopeptidase MepM/ murein hydrolase activator NlpD